MQCPRALTVDVDVDELGKGECHAPWWWPGNLAVHDGDDGFAQQVCQCNLSQAQLRHNVLRGDACYRHLQAHTSIEGQTEATYRHTQSLSHQ